MKVINLFLFLIVMTSSLYSALASASNPALNKNLYPTPNKWDQLVFSLGLGGGIEGLHLSLYKDKSTIVPVDYDAKFKLISRALNKALRSESTSNPFKSSFPHIYTTANIRKRKECPIYSTQLELDSNPITQEWLIVFPALKCLGGDVYEPYLNGADQVPHSWIIQRISANEYRILMEADSRYIHISHNDIHQGYKQISNEFHVALAKPDHPLQCGEAKLIWKYRKGRYQIDKVASYNIDHCWPRYADPGVLKHTWSNQMMGQAKPLIDTWVATFDQDITVITNNPYQYKITNPILNSVNNNELTESELKAIDILLE